MAKRTSKPALLATEERRPAPDQAVRDLITHELDQNLLVEASAGTGKTTSLVARMTNLIRAGRCRVDTLAAVTFTRKAAAELRSRFQLGLENAAREARGADKQRLDQAVAHVERAFIGTIHSFCARLLRERPVEAGVDPEFTELDDDFDNDLRLRAWREHVARLIACGDSLVPALENLGVDIAGLSSTFAQFAKYSDVDDWHAEEIALPDPEPVIRALGSYVERMQSLARTLPEDPGNDKLIRQYQQLPRTVRYADLSRPARLYAVLEPFANATPTVVQKLWPGGKAQALEETAAWEAFARDHATAYIEAMRAVRYHHILKALRPALDVYKRLRRDAGGLNFQDLLLGAARMLRAYSSIRRYFRSRFTHLLVDEFQDTDPVQAEVMLLLTADDPSETDWRRCAPVSGSLFVVGDPKQSIYRFRRADIVTYGEVKRIIQETGGRVVSLSANFRSTAPLVDWINEAFAKRFPSEATQIAPAHAPFLVGRVDERDGDLAGLYLLNIPGANKDEILDHETTVVARTIRHALDTNRKVPRSQRERDLPERAEPGDFLIVTRNTKNLSRYATELQALGVPHQVTGGTSLNESKELALLCTCLLALVRPDDPVALVAALRSELFGISDAALYAFKRARGRFSFRSAVPTIGLSQEDIEAIKEAFDRLSLYYRWLYVLPPPASVEKIAAHLGLLARAIAAPGGDVRAGSLAKVFELVRTAENEHLSLIDLVNYLSGLAGSEQKHDGISARPASAPVVRVMNLHKVKGLEAPIVFLSDPTGQFDHPINMHIDRSGARSRGYMAVYEPRSSVGHAPPRLIACPSGWGALERAEREFQEAENHRLLYVAATRAGTSLIVAQREKRAKENPWHPLVEDLSDQGVHQDPGPQTAPPRPCVTLSVEEIEAAASKIEKRREELQQPSYQVEAIKEAALKRVSPANAREEDRLRALRAQADSGPAEESFAGEHGVEWGEDLHVLLEAAMRDPDVNLEGLARSLTRERDGEEDRASALAASARAVGESDIWKRARASQHVLAEVPLMTAIPASEAAAGLATIRRGVIDLAFREPPGWVIVDYKTDRVGPGSIAGLIEHYRPQVESYAVTWHTLVGEPVHEVGLFFTRLGRYETVRKGAF